MVAISGPTGVFVVGIGGAYEDAFPGIGIDHRDLKEIVPPAGIDNQSVFPPVRRQVLAPAPGNPLGLPAGTVDNVEVGNPFVSGDKHNLSAIR